MQIPFDLPRLLFEKIYRLLTVRINLTNTVETLISGSAVSISGRSENNKRGAKYCAKADSRPGPRTKVNSMTKEDISEKK